MILHPCVITQIQSQLVEEPHKLFRSAQTAFALRKSGLCFVVRDYVTANGTTHFAAVVSDVSCIVWSVHVMKCALWWECCCNADYVQRSNYDFNKIIYKLSKKQNSL